MRKYASKISALFALFAIALTFVLVGIFSSSKVYAAWDGSGAGTADNPYQISTKAELEKFRDIVNGTGGETRNSSACAILTADINLENEDWTPIAPYGSTAYTGSFDGNNKKIEGLNVNVEGRYADGGLFGQLSGSAKIANLSVYGSVASTYNAGGIVGELAYSSTEFRDC
ncbi:MAG: hypothetical protein IJU60_02070 [Acholeplasmatales bacterium]|nr:hypothetical protein [Acholeplasmatales bacterium]